VVVAKPQRLDLLGEIRNKTYFHFSISCPIELKFLEVSRNSFSAFHLFILKKIRFRLHSQFKNKKALFNDPIFSDGFGSTPFNLCACDCLVGGSLLRFSKSFDGFLPF
jgi:hypothetical protein